jgi:hypothetical protein
MDESLRKKGLGQRYFGSLQKPGSGGPSAKALAEELRYRIFIKRQNLKL